MSIFSGPGGQRAAVSLTYDDALPVHREHVAPLLESHGVRGTFYVPINGNVMNYSNQWRDVAAAGHELGNHTLFHPCRREPPENYAWLAPEYDLAHYTGPRWEQEVRIANFILQQIDGRELRTFGNTCCNDLIGTGEAAVRIQDIYKPHFVAARGELTSELIDPTAANFGSLNHHNGDGATFDALKALVDAAIEQQRWLVLMFHGVGAGTHKGFIDVDEHTRFVEYLARRRDEVWAAPMVDVATRLQGKTR